MSHNTLRYGIKFVPCGETPEVYNVFYSSNDLWLGILYQEADGYYVWWQKGSVGDSWESYYLRIIADKLDELNQGWDRELALYFAEEQAKETGERPWPGFCQSCKAALYPPDRTDCPSCGACD